MGWLFVIWLQLERGGMVKDEHGLLGLVWNEIDLVDCGWQRDGIDLDCAR